MSQTPDHLAHPTASSTAQRPLSQSQAPPRTHDAPADMPVTNGKRRSSAAVAAATAAAANGGPGAVSPSPTGALSHSESHHHAHHLHKASLSGTTPPSPLDDLRTSANRRRRLVTYSIALATLVALSSVMERRTSLNAHHAKIQLSLPSSSSLSSLSDAGVTTSSDAALVPHQPAPVDLGIHPPADSALAPAAHDPVSAPAALPVDPPDERAPSTDAAPADPARQEPRDDGAQAPLAAAPPADDAPASDSSADQAAAAAPQKAQKADVNVSDQELKDSVDQLIAHVDQEAEQSASGNNSTLSVSDDALAHPGSTGHGGVDHFSSNSSMLPGAAPPAADAADAAGSGGVVVSGGVPEPDTGSGAATDAGRVTATPSGTGSAAEESRLNSQQHFDSAQKRLQAMMADDGLRVLVDENDHRTLQALALQATRGDCEQKSGASRSLFKTDAEAAANEDVERTEPLWGAWCLFMGSYKSDAMRDFVTKLRVVEDKVAKLRAATSASGNATEPHEHDGFDPNAASLDDVLTSDQQSALRSQMETIATHLTDEDRRYLAALSLQATFGDCGPYGREAVDLLRRDAADERAELRKLREPLLDETVTRRAGALWGAWCVMQGKKRTVAANELSSRVELLVEQLSSKSRAAAAAAAAAGSASAGSVPSSISALPASVAAAAGAPSAALAGKPPGASDESDDTAAARGDEAAKQPDAESASR